MRQPLASRSFSPFCRLPYALSLQGVCGHGALVKETLGEQRSRHNRGTAWRRAEALLRGSPWMSPDSIHLAKPPHEPSFHKPPRLSLSRELGQPDTQSDPPDSRTRPHGGMQGNKPKQVPQTVPSMGTGPLARRLTDYAPTLEPNATRRRIAIRRGVRGRGGIKNWPSKL